VPAGSLRYPENVSAGTIHVDRHESDAGSWEMTWRSAAPHLQDHVRRYCGYVEDGRPLRRRELPSGDVTLIVSLGPTIRLRGLEQDGPGERHASFVAGLDDAVTVTEHDGVQHGIEVNLTPLGAFQAFGLPMSELARRVVPLEDLLGTEAGRLAERLDDARGWEARFELLDAVLAARVAEHRPASPDVAWAWRRLAETDGRIPIGALTEELRCSRRHLTSRFREQVGMPPKSFARILRFDRVVRRLRGEGSARLAEIAHECGYYDQAHLNRDFRELAGSTPTEFLARLLPDGGGVSGA